MLICILARAVFVIGPDKRLKLSLLYPATTGRNFDEIIRVVDSLQLTATRKVATPVDWKQGGSCMVVPSVKQEDVAGLFPKGVTVHDVPSGKVTIDVLSSFLSDCSALPGLHQNYSPARVRLLHQQSIKHLCFLSITASRNVNFAFIFK